MQCQRLIFKGIGPQDSSEVGTAQRHFVSNPWSKDKQFWRVNGCFCKTWRRNILNREMKLSLLKSTFFRASYEHFIESIGFQEHTVLKIGQQWMQVVSEKGDFTREFTMKYIKKHVTWMNQ